MLSAWAITSLTLLSGPPVVCHGLGTLAGDDRSDLETLYAQGKTYVEFRDAATRRVAAWNDHYVAGNLDMRIINSTVGSAIMESHRTPDGRAATPTVILLTEDFEEAGCFVERPRHLQNWWLSNEDKLSQKDLLDQKYAWYAEDRGQETLEEIVAMIEAAAAGDPICTG